MALRWRKGGAIQGEENAEMVMNQNLQIRHHTEELEEILKSGKQVPAWVVSKLSRAADSISDATHYLEGTPDKMARGGNTRIVDISKLKTYVLTYIPVFDIKRAMQIKQKAVYAESEEDAIAQLPRTAKVISIKVTSGGGRGIPQRQRGLPMPEPEPMPDEDEINPEEIRAEIVALEQVLEVLEGEDRQSIQEQIEVLKIALEGMGNYAKGGEVFVCPVGTEIQTLIFDKSMFNLRQAKAWAKKNNFENAYVDGKLNTLRIRQKDPNLFVEDGFRTIQLRQGVQAVIGCPKRKISRKK
jgi:hypothetical protein